MLCRCCWGVCGESDVVRGGGGGGGGGCGGTRGAGEAWGSLAVRCRRSGVHGSGQVRITIVLRALVKMAVMREG